MVANCIRDRFQLKNYIETLVLVEEDFGYELCQISSFFGSDLGKFEAQLTTLTCALKSGVTMVGVAGVMGVSVKLTDEE